MWELIDAVPRFAVGFAIGGLVIGCVGFGLGVLRGERNSIGTPGETLRRDPPASPVFSGFYSADGVGDAVDTDGLARASHWLKHTPGRDAGACLAEMFLDPEDDPSEVDTVEIVRARPAASPDLECNVIG